jgi:hypothetical protein
MKIFVLCLLVVCAIAQTQPRTVIDFYLALPGGIYGIEGTQESELPGFESDFFFYANERNEAKASILKYRKSLIKIEDSKNGYLRLESNEWKGWAEIALFKRVDGSYVVAISQVRCEQDCTGGIIFATYKSGHWENVTKQVFPSSSQGYYRLPRIGTSIDLICGDKSDKSCHFGEKLAEFQWTKREVRCVVSDLIATQTHAQFRELSRQQQPQILARNVFHQTGVGIDDRVRELAFG